MKNKIFGLAIVSAICFTACMERKEAVSTSDEVQHPADSAEVLHTDVAIPENEPSDVTIADETSKEISVAGAVTEITRGKDGYTAKIKSIDGQTYFAIFSIPNLEDEYREVRVGETIKVRGASFMVGEDNHIKVKRFK